MTEQDLAEIERDLKLKLPRDYRAVLQARASDLATCDGLRAEDSELFLSREVIVRTNKEERPKESGTGYTFPGWWKTFFLIGTNGGGDFYCLRLDDDPGVWMIGSDCGHEPTLIKSTFQQFVDDAIEFEKERAKRQRLAASTKSVTKQAPAADDFEREIADVLESGTDVTWDFRWDHPKIPAISLKQQLEAFGTEVAGSRPVHEEALAKFVEWLDKNGDPVWSRYIKVRHALDGKTPGERYPELFEKWQEIGAAMRPGSATFDGFYFSGYRFATDEWWDDKTDDMENGLPSRVKAEKPEDPSRATRNFVRNLNELVRKTPVRGIDFEWHYAQAMTEILKSAGAQCLRALSFSNRSGDDDEPTGPALRALVQAPLTESLERLSIAEGVLSDQDALLLAKASFKRLWRLDLPSYCGMECSADSLRQLMATSWFRNLRQLRSGFSQECCETAILELAKLPHLHSLTLWNPPERQFLAFPKAGKFQALRRFYCNDVSLHGKHGEAFCQFEAPNLIELRLSLSRHSASELGAMTSASFFKSLRVLTLKSQSLNEAGLEAIAKSDCASKLRILQLLCGGSECVGNFHRLANTPLTNPEAFPAVSTLRIAHPFQAEAKRDTAEFLRKLATPRLRHLTLTDVDFDDECAEVLATSPTFANLRMLRIDQGYRAKKKLSAGSATNLLRSANLANLIAIEWHDLAVGDALDALCDLTILRKLRRGVFWSTGASSQTVEQVKKKRPYVHIGS